MKVCRKLTRQYHQNRLTRDAKTIYVSVTPENIPHLLSWAFTSSKLKIQIHSLPFWSVINKSNDILFLHKTLRLCINVTQLSLVLSFNFFSYITKQCFEWRGYTYNKMVAIWHSRTVHSYRNYSTVPFNNLRFWRFATRAFCSRTTICKRSQQQQQL